MFDREIEEVPGALVKKKLKKTENDCRPATEKKW
jgi:hypothetical protein